MHLGKTQIQFFLNSNLSFKTSVLHQFPIFSEIILQSCKINFSHSYTSSCIGSQFLWFNNYIRTDNNSVRFKECNRVIILTLSISYLHSREKLKTRITSKKNFNSPIIHITNLHKFH